MLDYTIITKNPLFYVLVSFVFFSSSISCVVRWPSVVLEETDGFCPLSLVIPLHSLLPNVWLSNAIFLNLFKSSLYCVEL